jgi:hypothetical protein
MHRENCLIEKTSFEKLSSLVHATKVFLNLSVRKRLMKILSKILIILVLISSCKKTDPTTLSITGNWELRESIGGFAADVKYAPGNGNILQFNSDMTFKMLFPSPPNTTGKYKFINILGNRDLLHLNFDSAGYSDVTDSLKIEGDKLILTTPPQCCDVPYENIYQKIN